MTDVGIFRKYVMLIKMIDRVEKNAIIRAAKIREAVIDFAREAGLQPVDGDYYEAGKAEYERMRHDYQRIDKEADKQVAQTYKQARVNVGNYVTREPMLSVPTKIVISADGVTHVFNNVYVGRNEHARLVEAPYALYKNGEKISSGEFVSGGQITRLLKERGVKLTQSQLSYHFTGKYAHRNELDYYGFKIMRFDRE